MRSGLADQLALRELLRRHARAFSARDFDALDEVFTPDAVLDSRAVGGERHVWTEAKPWLHSSFGAVRLFRLHVGDSEIHIDGDSAAMTTTNHVVFQVDEGAAPIVAFGVYEDRAVRTDRGWRLVERVDRPLARMTGAPA